MSLLSKFINLKKHAYAHIYIPVMLPVTTFLLQCYFFYSRNLYLSHIFSMLLNILTIPIIIFYITRFYYNNYIKSSYSQLYDYFNILSETNDLPSIAFVHDIKNIIFALSGYIHFKNYDKAQKKINDLCNIVQLVKDKSVTGNYCVDRLIQAKLNKMNKSNIKFEVINDLSLPLKLDNLDLCVLIGNSLDNAIEACSKIPPSGHKYINLLLTNDKNSLEITVCNTTINSVNTNFKTTKFNSKYHGFGIKNIKAILRKYHGNLYINQHNNYFTIVMKLNLISHSLNTK